jgi:hypothetical protein
VVGLGIFFRWADTPASSFFSSSLFPLFVLIIYLLFRLTHPPPEMVREKRPGSVQTRRQEIFVDTFHSFIRSLRIIFHGRKMALGHHLRAQAKLLHGWEKRRGKYVPKGTDGTGERVYYYFFWGGVH